MVSIGMDAPSNEERWKWELARLTTRKHAPKLDGLAAKSAIGRDGDVSSVSV